MEGDGGERWLGLVADEATPGRWRFAVTPGLASGATALFGGCATAAALVVARSAAPQPLVWASAHFGAFAPLGSEVVLDLSTISSGRTMTHLEVVGTVEGRQSFVVRVAAGDRPTHAGAGQWWQPPLPDVPGPGDSPPFPHPTHEETWAARFDWRLAGSTEDGSSHPWSAWWVRPKPDEADRDPLVWAAVLCDYVTYAMGRALGLPMGGLSIDNVLRIHRPSAAATAEWLLLEVRPQAIEGGFGHGVARLVADGELVAIGSQSVVLNQWDWRLPSER